MNSFRPWIETLEARWTPDSNGTGEGSVPPPPDNDDMPPIVVPPPGP